MKTSVEWSYSLRKFPRSVHAVSRDELFGASRLPIAARRIEFHEPVAPRILDCVTLSLVHSGSYLKVLPDRTVPMRPGRLMIRDNTVPAGYYPRQRSVVLNVYLGRRLLSRELRWLGHRTRSRDVLGNIGHRRGPGLLVLDVPEHLQVRLVAAFLDLVDPSVEGREFARLARLLEVVDAIEGVLANGAGDPSALDGPHRGREAWPAALAHAVRLLEADPTAPWTAERLAREVHVTSRQLFRLFAAIGTTPREYLVDLRLTRVALLLDTTAMSFTRATQQVGWHNPHHVRILFVRHFGLDPEEYRHRP